MINIFGDILNNGVEVCLFRFYDESQGYYILIYLKVVFFYLQDLV